LMISEASLNDLNSKLEQKIDIRRFRPNIVITGAEPYMEDRLEKFIVAGITMYGVKPCARCVMTGVDPDTAHTGAEPLKTLAKYRRSGNKVLFGQNLVHDGTGNIAVEDELLIEKLRPLVL
jgi:uncharacterized protein